MKILIAEDEMLISEMLKEILIDQNHEVVGQVMSFEEAIDFLDNNSEIDMVICDINFNSNKTGIDLGREIREKYACAFIYLTSYSDDKTMLEAIETKPSAYLVKPFSAMEIKAAMLVAQAHFSESDKSIVFKDGYSAVKIYSKEIDYIQSESNYITIFTAEKKHVIRSSMDSFLQKLDCENIVRVHRSFAVNFEYIRAIRGNFVYVKNEKIPLSRKYKELMTDIFEKAGFIP